MPEPMPSATSITIIVAMARNRAIGRRGALPWHIPADLARFKQLTMGHAIIMGRHTYESLPHGALPGRRNIVVSRTVTALPGCEVYGSLQEALAAAAATPSSPTFPISSLEPLSTPSLVEGGKGAEAFVFIIGGASLYRQALPYCDHIALTLVDAMPTDADTFFPDIDNGEWTVTARDDHPGYSFVTLVRKRAMSIVQTREG